jgi:hypothetical protein
MNNHLELFLKLLPKPNQNPTDLPTGAQSLREDNISRSNIPSHVSRKYPALSMLRELSAGQWLLDAGSRMESPQQNLPNQ